MVGESKIIEFYAPLGNIYEALKSQFIVWERDRVYLPRMGMGRVSFRVLNQEHGMIKYALIGRESDCYAYKSGFERIYSDMLYNSFA